MKRARCVWIRVFPTFPCPPSPPKFVWVRAGRSGILGCQVKPGRIMFEIDGVSVDIAREALTPGRCEAADQDALQPAIASEDGIMKAEDIRALSADQLTDELLS